MIQLWCFYNRLLSCPACTMCHTCRYMKWDLGGGVGLVARCEYDAVMPYHGQKKVFINVKALNEWDPKVRLYSIISPFGVSVINPNIFCCHAYVYSLPRSNVVV